MKSRGFTLIELIMAMILIGILSVMASPIFQNLPGTRAQAAAFRLRSDLRYIQMLAIETQQTTRVVFDAPANTYQLQILDTAGWQPVVNPGTHNAFTVPLNTGDFQGVTLSQVNFNNASELRFNALGVPSDGAGAALADPAYVKLSGLFQISVAAVTGKIDVAAL